MSSSAETGPERALLGPAAILELSVTEVDALLDRLERTVPRTPPWVDLASTGATEAILMGDTHGDWPSVETVVREFLANDRWALVGLGDYVDRTPADCPMGSVANALFLLQVAALAAPRVVLIRGNHETVGSLPVAPRSLEPEVEQLWGRSPRRSGRIVDLLNRGPLAATSPSGAYLAHGGFPRSPWPTPWTKAIDPSNPVRLAEIAWADCAVSHNRRGVAPAFREGETKDFLEQAGLRIFVRGHDPDITRRSIYDGRCITLHTTRYYARFGGVITARLPLTTPVQTVADLRIVDVPASLPSL